MNEFERLVDMIEYWHGFGSDSVDFANFLFDNGVILPPVKIGDTVYRLIKHNNTKKWSIKETKVKRITISQTEIQIVCEGVLKPACFGELVFQTREEAGNALREKRFGR